MTAKRTTHRARGLRAAQGACEARLWRELRAGRLAGLKFRRQHPVGGYVVDFACEAGRLAVEVDGPSHGGDEQAAYDARRSEDLAALGWTVLRVTNGEVLGETGAVLAKIRVAAGR